MREEVGDEWLRKEGMLTTVSHRCRKAQQHHPRLEQNLPGALHFLLRVILLHVTEYGELAVHCSVIAFFVFLFTDHHTLRLAQSHTGQDGHNHREKTTDVVASSPTLETNRWFEYRETVLGNRI